MDASSTFLLRILTPIEPKVEREVHEVIVETQAGQLTIYANHGALVSTLQPGEMMIRDSSGAQSSLVVLGGVLQFTDNTLTVLADAAEHPAEIDVQAAEDAAQQLMREIAKQTTTMDIGTYELMVHELERAQARVAVAKKWRK